MTLDEWMNPVVAEFPRPLQQHLRSEYRAHYQDHLSAGGAEDAQALFGDPEETKRQLKKVYLTQEVLEGRPNVVYVVVFSLLCTYFNTLHLYSRLPQHAHFWALLDLVLVPIGAAWLWKRTWKWEPSRQKLFRTLGLMTLGMTLWIFQPVQIFHPLPFSGLLFLLQLQPWWAIAGVIGGIYSMFAMDARVRRTLDPVGWHKA